MAPGWTAAAGPLTLRAGGVVMRRWKLFGPLAVAGLALVAVVAAMIAHSPQPLLDPQATYERRRELMDRLGAGMTRADVEAVLGPPGDYRTAPYADTFDGGRSPADISWSPPSRTQYWEWDSAVVDVTYSEDGIIKSGGCRSYQIRQQAPLDNLLWRAKRQLRKWFPER
jgi:hypothetical protein